MHSENLKLIPLKMYIKVLSNKEWRKTQYEKILSLENQSEGHDLNAGATKHKALVSQSSVTANTKHTSTVWGKNWDDSICDSVVIPGTSKDFRVFSFRVKQDKGTTVIPQLTAHSTLTLSAARHNTLCQVHKFLGMMPKMSLSCWLPWSGIHDQWSRQKWETKRPEEPYPEPKDRIVMVLYLTEGLELIWAGCKMFGHFDSNKQQAELDK